MAEMSGYRPFSDRLQDWSSGRLRGHMGFP